MEKTLFAIHTAAATMTKCPEFSLDKDDAKLMGEAVAGVLAFHKIRMSPKQEAYAILMEAAAQIYPPMVVSIYFRKKMEAEEAAKKLPPPHSRPTVVPFPTANAPKPSIVPPGFDTFDPGRITIPEG